MKLRLLHEQSTAMGEHDVVAVMHEMWRNRKYADEVGDLADYFYLFNTNAITLYNLRMKTTRVYEMLKMVMGNLTRIRKYLEDRKAKPIEAKITRDALMEQELDLLDAYKIMMRTGSYLVTNKKRLQAKADEFLRLLDVVVARNGVPTEPELRRMISLVDQIVFPIYRLLESAQIVKRYSETKKKKSKKSEIVAKIADPVYMRSRLAAKEQQQELMRHDREEWERGEEEESPAPSLPPPPDPQRVAHNRQHRILSAVGIRDPEARETALEMAKKRLPHGSDEEITSLAVELYSSGAVQERMKEAGTVGLGGRSIPEIMRMLYGTGAKA